MKNIKTNKKKKLILIVSFLIVFSMLVAVGYNSYSATKEYFLGDMNVDGEITLSDELLLLRHIYSMKTEKNNNWKLIGDGLINADINEDKAVDISDVLYIKRYLLAQKDTNVANKHEEWKTLCKKVTKSESDVVKTYTLTVKPGNQTYTEKAKTEITVNAPEINYTITFDGNGGSVPEVQKSIRGFSKWTLSGAGKIEDKEKSPTTYTFGEGNATLTANYNQEGNGITLPVSERGGYTFEGWYDSKEFTNKIGNVDEKYIPTEDITLYAKWESENVEQKDISLNKTSTTIDLSNSSTEKLIATTNVSGKLSWSSSNTNVATVSEEGLVTGLANGETTITVRNEENGVATCNVIVQTSPTEISLNITEQTLDLSSNTTFTLKPTIIPSTANVNRTMKIKSSDTRVASIASTGVVTAVSNGTSIITFETANGKTATCNVTVQTSPTSVSLDKTYLTIDSSISSEQKLTATIDPTSSNVYTKLTWRSSNSNIATVSENGLVTGKATGSTTITVETQNGKSAFCNVDVKMKQTEETEIKLDKTSLTIDLSSSRTQKLIATTNSTENLSWISSNTNIATVSDDGLVTGKANGETIITVKDSTGAIATCNVIVQTSPTGISLNIIEQTLDLSGNKTFTIIPSITPTTANINNAVFIESNNSSVASVTSDGIVTGVSNGITKIIARTSNGKEAICNVTVQTSPTGITLNATEVTLDLSGTKTFTLTSKITPTTANVNTTLYAKSNNTDVATISENGVITGISNGTASITVETKNGKKATCKIVVQTTPTGIYFKENKDDATKYISVKKGEKGNIKAMLEPSTSNVNTDITYTIASGNSKVASIDSNTGNITGKQSGVVTIQAKTSNGKIANIDLNVKIGNEVFDTYNTVKLRANTSESLLHTKGLDLSKNSTIGQKSHFQAFAVESNGVYYCSYPGNKKNTIGKLHISFGDPNETPYKCMTLNYFGHGSCFELEKGSGGGKVWIDSITQGKDTSGAYEQGYAITRIQWENNGSYYIAAGTVKVKDTSGKVLKTYENTSGENFVFTTNGEVKTALKVAIDETNRLMSIKKGNYYYIFDLDEALEIKDATFEVSSNIADYESCIIEFKAKDLNSIEPLTSFKLPTPKSEDDITWHAWQGFDLDGDYIYIGEGGYTNKVSPTLWDGKAFITVLDYMYGKNGNAPTKKKTEVAAVSEEWNASKKLLALMGDDGSGNYNLAQLEGLRVTTQGGIKEMYLGFDSTFESTGKRSTNILKYSY